LSEVKFASRTDIFFIPMILMRSARGGMLTLLKQITFSR